MMTSGLHSQSAPAGQRPTAAIIRTSRPGPCWVASQGDAPAAAAAGTGPARAGRTVSDDTDAALPEFDVSTPVRCPPVAAGPLSDSAATAVALRFKVLGYPIRVKLMSILFGSPAREECGRVLAAAVGLPETTVSRHLQQLRLAGFIESQRRGMHVFHRPHLMALNALGAALDTKVALPEGGCTADGSRGANAQGGDADVDATSVVSFQGHASRAGLHRASRGNDTPLRRTARPRFRSA